jgi:hypothetical protein
MDDDAWMNLPPGSTRAIAAGCTCDPERNAHGAGVVDAEPGARHVPHDGCPIHGLAALARMLDDRLPDDPS